MISTYERRLRLQRIQMAINARTPVHLNSAGSISSRSSIKSTDSPSGSDRPAHGKLMARARDLFSQSTAHDFSPLRKGITSVLTGDDATLLARAKALYEKLPSLGEEIINAQGSEETLYKILSAAAATGLSGESKL